MEITRRWQVAQFFERWWWKRYLQDKSADEYLQWKRGYWDNIIQRMGYTHPQVASLLKQENLMVLDAGCGPAGIFLSLPQHRVTAVDPLWSYYAQQFAQFNYHRFNYVQFKTAGLEQFRSTSTFDLVCCMNALNHVADIEKASENLAASVKPGGWIALTLDVHNYRPLRSLFRAIPGDILHPHQYTWGDYLQLLERHGLQYVSTQKVKRGFIFDHELLLFRKA